MTESVESESKTSKIVMQLYVWNDILAQTHTLTHIPILEPGACFTYNVENVSKSVIYNTNKRYFAQIHILDCENSE